MQQQTTRVLDSPPVSSRSSARISGVNGCACHSVLLSLYWYSTFVGPGASFGHSKHLRHCSLIRMEY